MDWFLLVACLRASGVYNRNIMDASFLFVIVLETV